MLDIGTGSGNVALLLADAGFEVTGIDLAEGMLDRARAKATAHPRPPTFRHGDAVAPPFPAGSFDAIVSRYLLWTLRDASAAIARWHELLRPGGTLLAIDAGWFPPGEGLPLATERQRHFAAAYDDRAFAGLPSATPGRTRSLRSGRPPDSWTCASILCPSCSTWTAPMESHPATSRDCSTVSSAVVPPRRRMRCGEDPRTGLFRPGSFVVPRPWWPAPKSRSDVKRLPLCAGLCQVDTSPATSM